MDTTYYDMPGRQRSLWLVAFVACGSIIGVARLYLWGNEVITDRMLFWIVALIFPFWVMTAIMAGRANDEIGNKRRGFEVRKNDDT